MASGLTRAAIATELAALAAVEPHGRLRHARSRLAEIPGAEVAVQPFADLGWTRRAAPSLRVTAPVPATLAAAAFTYCGATPAGGVAGELRRLGEHRVGGAEPWDKLAIMRDGETVAYVSARREGAARPAALGEGSRVVPHFALGAEDGRRLLGWLDDGVTVAVAGEIDCVLDADATSANLLARLPGAAAAGPGRDGRILICGSVDPAGEAGALAATLALAACFAREPCARPLDVLLLDGGRRDLAGAKAHVARAWPAGGLDDIALAVVLDAVARAGERVQLWVGPEQLEERLLGVAAAAGTPVRTVTPPPLGADHVPLHDAGVPVCAFAAAPAGDHAAPPSAEEVLRVAALAHAAVAALAAEPLRFTSRDSLSPRPGWRSIQRAAYLEVVA